MSTPLYLVSGLDEAAMTTAALGLQVDLPRAVVVRHELDAGAGTLRSTVSDLTGVLERETVLLDHACASCAVREDILPTLERLGQLGRWLLGGVHDHAVTDAWAGEVFEGPSRDAEGADCWRLDLRSDVPLHPRRLHEEVSALGGGRHRSRGCFWVASRPDQIGVWEGAGGQLSIGVNGSWGRSRAFTRLLFTGRLEDDVRSELRRAFQRSLLTDAERRARGSGWSLWESSSDGLEPWLGPIEQVA